jgi:metal-responsive CopG/Arc/MetJ family transcriptional regulator
MHTIQMTIDEELLGAVDQLARELEMTRSRLIREALGRYLEERRSALLEEAHRAAYERVPQLEDEIASWEGLQHWPRS